MGQDVDHDYARKSLVKHEGTTSIKPTPDIGIIIDGLQALRGNDMRLIRERARCGHQLSSWPTMRSSGTWLSHEGKRVQVPKPPHPPRYHGCQLCQFPSQLG
ncbi:hypothetical protein SKAU_G00240230 [Synaphobranchus kaupii]|uniref:Uncharacterized protein n=1 Tax=Synaphobranchus kaupii TaxID=118154 RepID=A0A9Q1F7B8_SYNKA|nr:hypothetical protein SKAU_G00240230 [Synaphobranchus kaupii]